MVPMLFGDPQALSSTIASLGMLQLQAFGSRVETLDSASNYHDIVRLMFLYTGVCECCFDKLLVLIIFYAYRFYHIILYSWFSLVGKETSPKYSSPPPSPPKNKQTNCSMYGSQLTLYTSLGEMVAWVLVPVAKIGVLLDCD